MATQKKTEHIEIKGAKVNNLKNIDLNLPRNQFIVITGLSGSGKSSLAFDTLYAEGQRRYVESLSAYARQFLGRMQKPEVDYIKGIPPAIAIEQRVNSSNPRSTVGTTTEIYDYLKLLFARIGKTLSPISGREVKRHSVTDVVDYITKQKSTERLLLLAPVNVYSENLKLFFEELTKEGFQRYYHNHQVLQIEDIVPTKFKDKQIQVIVDRFQASNDEESVSRFSDSTLTAFKIGKGRCGIVCPDTKKEHWFSNTYEEDGILYEEPNVNMFSFNSPLGACPQCEGYGKVLGIDEDLVIPKRELSVYADAIVPWRSEAFSKWKEELIKYASKYDFPIHKPYTELSTSQRSLLWNGNEKISGINGFFNYLEENKYKIQYRVMLARYRGKTICPVCNGSRLKPEAAHVKIHGHTITEWVQLPIGELLGLVNKIKLTEHEQKIAGRLLVEVSSRLEYMNNVGLGYLTLNRLSATLSGGESQRINLATALGSSLVGSLYILDEPSIGLHSRDTQRLIEVLLQLKKIGNTVIVVEHDEEIMRAADRIIDIGPGAGRLGGTIVYNGDHEGLIHANSITADYLTGRKKIEVPVFRRKPSHFIKVKGARENNLKNIDVTIPLHVMTVVTGVSGSGKSSLIKNIVYPFLSRIVNDSAAIMGKADDISGDISLIKSVEFVDQNPIGRSSRSNPVTYSKAYDDIRTLYAKQAHAQHLGFTASHFSFNIDGGRCDECQGEGEISVEMQFMADVKLVCESCKGKKFKDDVLEVKYRNKNIFDILEMTIDEAIVFFGEKEGSHENKIIEKLKPLADVGLGYVKLGQSSSTLSGGESQRVKLASFMGRESKTQSTLFIFDEPTTGLHFHDIHKLLEAFNSLIKKGHSILVIEHNPEVIKNADWIIDLGSEGGDKGGKLLYEGSPEGLVQVKESYTGMFLKGKLK